MPAKSYGAIENMIARDEVTENVALAAAQGVALGFAGLEKWQRATLRRKALEIYDINGELLFYDYPIAGGNEIVGTVRAAASKIIGTPIIAHEIGPRGWDYAQAVEQLTPKVARRFARGKILDVKLVCYSYPKLGVMFTVQDGRGQTQRLIFDVASLNPIPEASPKDEREGAYAWSFYDAISVAERKTRLKRYEKIDQWRSSLSVNKRNLVRAETNIGKLVVAVEWPWTVKYTKQLQFCTHYNYTEARSHHCFVLQGQQVDDYCAVATCQMILCYYRYYYTQAQIAPQLGYSPGGCPSNQAPGYEALTGNHLDATFDNAPTWEKARTEIDALHPLKSGIARHARACAGYSYIKNTLFGTITQKQLYIYDPWPWNADYKLAGAIKWENWDAITHTNYVCTSLIYP